MTTKLFGTKVARVEDQRFLRGHGRYADDVLVGLVAPTRRWGSLAALVAFPPVTVVVVSVRG